MRSIYLDNAATTQVDPEILDLIIDTERNHYANSSSLHEQGLASAKLIKEARKFFANSINAKSEEIIWTSGATESNNMIVNGLDHELIITSTIEHPSLLEPIKNSGKPIIWIDSDHQGYINLDQISNALNSHTGQSILLSIMHANNEIGTIQNLSAIGQIKSKYPQVIFHSDWAQSFGKYTLDVEELNLDSLSASGHKIHSSKGVGLLYLKEQLQKNFKPLLEGGGQESGLRSGTLNNSGILALAKAFSLAQTRQDHICKLQNHLHDSIKSIPGVVLNGPSLEDRLLGNLNLSFTHLPFNSEDLVLQLSLRGVCVSSGSACSSHNNQSEIVGSYVLRACRINPELISKAIRISLSRFNTQEDIDYLIQVLKQLHNI